MARLKKSLGKAVGKVSAVGILMLGFKLIGQGDLRGIILIAIALGVFWYESAFSPEK